MERLGLLYNMIRVLYAYFTWSNMSVLDQFMCMTAEGMFMFCVLLILIYSMLACSGIVTSPTYDITILRV